MTQLLLYINNQWESLDIDETIMIPINYQISDISDFTIKNSSYSKDIEIVDTIHNRKVFQYIKELSSDSEFDPRIKVKCIVLRDSLIQLEGNFKVSNIKQNKFGKNTYVCNIFTEVDTLMSNMSNKYLTDLDLSDYNHTWDENSIRNAWPKEWTNGYQYPMINYGVGQFSSLTMKKQSYSQYFPAIYTKTLFDKIISSNGYTYTSQFLNSSPFTEMIIPFSNGKLVGSINFTINPSDNSLFKSRLGYTNVLGSQEIVAPALYVSKANLGMNIEDYDPNGVYDNATYFYQNTLSSNYAQYINLHLNIRWGVDFDTTFGFSSTLLFNDSTDDIKVYVCREVNPATGVSQSLANNPTWGQIMTYPKITFGSVDYVSLRSLFTNSGVTYSSYNATYSGGAGTYTWKETTFDVYSDILKDYPILENERVKFYIVRGSYAIVGPGMATYQQPTEVKIGSYIRSIVDPSQAIYGGTLNMSKNVPVNVYQRDWFGSILKEFNLYIDVDKDNPKNLLIEPRDTFLANNYNLLDWGKKLDVKKEVMSEISSMTQDKTNIFKYKDDSDYYNTLYTGITKRSFGEYRYTYENEFITSEKTMELIFSPTPVDRISGTNLFIPQIFDLSGSDVTQLTNMNIRHLHYKWLPIPAGDVFVFYGATQTHYPHSGYYDDPVNPTTSFNFGEVINFYSLNGSTNTPISTPDGIILYGGIDPIYSNLFTNYYLNQFGEINDKNSRIVTAYFHLTAADIESFRFGNCIYFKYNGSDGIYRILTIVDYNPLANESTMVTMMKIRTESLPFLTSYVPTYQSVDYQPSQIINPSNKSMAPGSVINGSNNLSTGQAIINGSNNINNGNFNRLSGTSILVSGDGNGVYGNRNFVMGLSNSISDVTSNIIVNGDSNIVYEGSSANQIYGNGNTIVSGVTNSTIVGNNVTATQSNSYIINKDVVINGSTKTNYIFGSTSSTASSIATTDFNYIQLNNITFNDGTDDYFEEYNWSVEWISNTTGTTEFCLITMPESGVYKMFVDYQVINYTNDTPGYFHNGEYYTSVFFNGSFDTKDLEVYDYGNMGINLGGSIQYGTTDNTIYWLYDQGIDGLMRYKCTFKLKKLKSSYYTEV